MKTAMDLRVLCAALGFTAVVMQGGRVSKEEGKHRAATFGGLIEDFCREYVPEAFEETGNGMPAIATTGPGGKFAQAERMATVIIGIYREKGGCVEHDLSEKGFTDDEIQRHWAMANALAKVALNITDA